ncbi:Origin recognition complex, subunit 1 [Malassezia equina]|uniref:Origin recognition complex subunit 1 n=1 Tax=Malassezia equina TaxID=1381935 RepID=A0AAF0EIV5_9BASI|nr:Origin recognition complex, subunit 1 [Malassezia equina]
MSEGGSPLRRSTRVHSRPKLYAEEVFQEISRKPASPRTRKTPEKRTTVESPDVSPAKRQIVSAGTQAREAVAPSRKQKSALPSLALLRRPHSVHALPEAILSKMSPHERARRLLHVGSTPESLPCRQEQFVAVVGCAAEALRTGAGGCAYVCGVPGTGKTATVRESVRALQSQQERGELPAFSFVEINGMKLASPMQAYTELWCAISGTGQRLHPRAALSKLSAFFSSGMNAKKTPTVVLMDELDLFVTSRQDVIYNMFHWPDLPDSNLVVIAVANTMDLPERTLQPKVASRLGMTRIPFMPYTDRQLLDIVRARLDIDEQGQRCSSVAATAGCETVFKIDALVFASKRVANVSGDARRMLDVCRRAVEGAEERALAQQVEPAPITIHDIREVMDRMARSGRAAHIAALSRHAKLLLASMFACIRRTGVSEVVWKDVLMHHTALCRTHSVARLGMAGNDYNEHELLRPLSTLCQLGLVVAVGAGAGSARGGSYARYLLAVQEDEVHVALGEGEAEWQSLFTPR